MTTKVPGKKPPAKEKNAPFFLAEEAHCEKDPDPFYSCLHRTALPRFFPSCIIFSSTGVLPSSTAILLPPLLGPISG
jgi:hypothetical protein